MHLIWILSCPNSIWSQRKCEKMLKVHKKLPVSVNAGLHLLQLVWPEGKGVEADQQSVEAPRTFKEAWVLDNVKPAAAVDVNQEQDYPLQFFIMFFEAAVQP